MWNGKTWVGTLSKAIINDGNWHDLQVDFSDSTGIAHIVVDGKLDTTNVQGEALRSQ